jgi:hypothetical protein
MIILLTYRFGRKNYLNNNIYKVVTFITFPSNSSHGFGYSKSSSGRKNIVCSYSQNNFFNLKVISH